MHEAIELLERYGIVKDEDTLGIADLSKQNIFRLHEKLIETVYDKQADDFVHSDGTSELDPFSFVASRSLRGESDCGMYKCRLERLDVISRFAALYATRVILPLAIKSPPDGNTTEWSIRQLSHSALALLRLRPLIDAGLVRPAVMAFPVCECTKEWADEMLEVVHDVADQAAEDLQDKYKVRFQLPEKSWHGRPAIEIHGPEDFVDHGSLYMLIDEPKNFRLKSWRFDKQGTVELRGQRKLDLLRGFIFRAIAAETSFYFGYGRRCNARYLASRRGETFLLDMVTRRRDEELSASSAALNAFMTHSLPLLGDIPVAKLLEIRKQERDSFERYRIAVSRIMEEVSRKKKRIGQREVRELFNEQIEPELARMKSELRQESKRQFRRIVGGVGAIAASIALGTFSSALPWLGAVPAAMVGGGLLSKAAQSTCEHGASLKEKNDFYFLLRLTQEV